MAMARPVTVVGTSNGDEVCGSMHCRTGSRCPVRYRVLGNALDKGQGD